jgi:hypothetical protein
MSSVPVLIVSRREEDDVPAATLISLAFNSFAQAWPLLCKQKGEDAGTTIQAASDYLETIYGECSRLTKSFNNLSRIGHSTLKEAAGVAKIRDDLTRGIDSLRSRHPQLAFEPPIPLDESAPPDPWESPEATLFVEAIGIYLDKQNVSKPRYPKKLSDIDLSNELITWATTVPNSLEHGKMKLKAQRASQLRKRARPGDDAVVEGRGEEEDDPSGNEQQP